MTSKFIDVNGIRLHYIEEGTGELVILLHGFPEFWYGWREQIPVLSKKFRIVAPDMRGFNLSDMPNKVSDYKIEILAKDIADLISGLGEKQAIIVGHDWGAIVGWAIAAFHPNVVKKLAILNVPHPSEMTFAFKTLNLSQWRKSWYIFFFQIPFIPDLFVGKGETFFRKTFWGMSRNKEAFNSEVINRYVQAYKKPNAASGPLGYYRSAFRRIFSEPVYPKILAPVMMLWGEQDKALGKELTVNTGKYCAHNFEIHYDPKSGHFLQHDNPVWVNEMLSNFIERVD